MGLLCFTLSVCQKSNLQFFPVAENPNLQALTHTLVFWGLFFGLFLACLGIKKLVLHGRY